MLKKFIGLHPFVIEKVSIFLSYCDSFYKFLPQTKVISLGVDLVLSELKKEPKALIVCGSYTIGDFSKVLNFLRRDCDYSEPAFDISITKDSIFTVMVQKSCFNF